MKTFEEWYAEEYGRPYSPGIVSSHMAVKAWNAAIESAKEQSGEAVNQQLLGVARSILAEDMLLLLPAEYVAKVRAAIAAAEAAQPAPAVPEEWRAAVAELLASDGSGGIYDAARCITAHDKLRTLLAAAPQPAQPATTPSTVTDDELLDEFWAHAMVRRDGAIVGLVQALRAVEQLVSRPVQQLPAVIEDIAQQWDGCIYDSPSGDIDIGQAIRAAGKRLVSEQQEGGGDAQI